MWNANLASLMLQILWRHASNRPLSCWKKYFEKQCLRKEDWPQSRIARLHFAHNSSSQVSCPFAIPIWHSLQASVRRSHLVHMHTARCMGAWWRTRCSTFCKHQEHHLELLDAASKGTPNGEVDEESLPVLWSGLQISGKEIENGSGNKREQCWNGNSFDLGDLKKILVEGWIASVFKTQGCYFLRGSPGTLCLTTHIQTTSSLLHSRTKTRTDFEKLGFILAPWEWAKQFTNN